MLGTRSSWLVRPHLSAAAIDVVLAGLLLLLLGSATLLTPAFTDYEVEAEAAIRALARGNLADGFAVMPVYAGSVLAVAPLAAITHALGGGDLALFRMVAVPGAAVVVALAALAARWLRAAAASRRTQLIAVGAIALSPCVALAWNFGHFEEPLVAGAALGGLIVAQRGDTRGDWLGGALLGLAVAGKLWAVVLLPVALVAAPTRAAAMRLAVGAALASSLVLGPYLATQLGHVGRFAGDTGDIFSEGNAWWFLGHTNPNFDANAPVKELFTSDNSARLAPALVAEYARKLIVVVAAALSAGWFWRVRRSTDADAPARLSSLLWLAGAVLWWRASLDPWFQPYYLTGALVAIVLADARVGRLPQLGLIAWAALWLLHGPEAITLGLSADGQSLVTLLWTLPVGLLITRRALRPGPSVTVLR